MMLKHHSVGLVGLDFGTTTSSALFAQADVTKNLGSGRMGFTGVKECFAPPMIRTPVCEDGLDLQALDHALKQWLAANPARELWGGGALITGLAAEQENATALVELIRHRVGHAIVARAEDPRFESWLAFMGNSYDISKNNPDVPVLNFDIGGGTTNVALGLDGHVCATGSFYVGARHFQVHPTTYRIQMLSSYAKALSTALKICKSLGDELDRREVNAIARDYVNVLEQVVWGSAVMPALVQASFQVPTGCSMDSAIITFSGGVGQIIYNLAAGGCYATTEYGDLGIDMAVHILSSPILARNVSTHVPRYKGRATSYGLLRYSTSISGNTLFIPPEGILPLENLPILAKLSAASTREEMHTCMEAIIHARGGAATVHFADTHWVSVEQFCEKFREVFVTCPFSYPLVLIVDANVGKVLGQCLTQWGAFPMRLLVIDEIPFYDAQFVHVGRPKQSLIPVSFHGLQ